MKFCFMILHSLTPAFPPGFWFCADLRMWLAVQVNAGCLRTLGSWEYIGRYEAFFLRFCYVLVVCADRKSGSAWCGSCTIGCPM